MFTLSAGIREVVRKTVGLDVEDVSMLSPEEETSLVNRLCKTFLGYAKPEGDRMIGRGNPFIASGRWQDMDEIDRRIAEVVK